MNFKKLLAMLTIFSFFILSANAVTSINSCGFSSFTSNETFVLNFSDYGNADGSACLTFTSGTYSNVTLIQNNSIPLITISKNNAGSQIDFIKFNNGAFISNFTINGINIEVTNPELGSSLHSANRPHFIEFNPGASSCTSCGMNPYLIENSNIEGFYSLITQYYLNTPTPSTLGSIVNTTYTGRGVWITGNQGSLTIKGNNNFFDVFLFTRNSETGTSGFNRGKMLINDSVVVTRKYYTGSNPVLTLAQASTSLYGMLIQGQINNDTNDDNVADSTLVSFVHNSVIYRDYRGITFIQDVNEGMDFSFSNKIIAPINDEQIDFSTNPLILGTSTGNILDVSYGLLNLTQIKAIDVGNNDKIDCSFVNSNKCAVEFGGSGTSATNFRGGIILGSNNIINNTNITRLAVNDWNFISNNADVQKNNLTITNNQFNDEKVPLFGNTSTTASNVIKLYSNNVEISNNVFNPVDTSGESEFIYLHATNPASNNIFLNRFGNNIVTPSSNSEVFTWYCGARFYNNFLDNNVTITSSCSSGLNATPLVAYNHTDGKIYYFRIGNYYADNTGCVDGDSNGICDSSYTSGNITDTKPLSSYPFDFASHILTADVVVDTTNFNITIVEPTANQTLTIAGLSSNINTTFNHDSSFPDLTCDFVIDGASVSGATITNTPSNTNKSIQTNGYTEGNHTFRIECYNDYTFKTSNEITFTIAYTGGGENQTGNQTTGNQTSLPTITGSDLIDTTSTTATTDNVVDFGSNAVAFVFNLIIPFFVLVAIIGVILFLLLVAT